ncbi:MAG: ABC transporter ATP-binding protein [Candidatus Cyclobacteriaceae bacterium M3_2C_046]
MKTERSTAHPVLNCQNLAVGYQKGRVQKTILKDLNLKLLPGELVCLLGPNGVGKSTLLRTIAGIQPPLRGSVQVLGQPLSDLSQRGLAQKISLVLTERIMSANLSVLELISLGRYPYTDWSGRLSANDQEIIAQAIEHTHTSYILDQKVHELSDGQLQKVMIARAIAQDGNLMILDEPTAHLDLNNKVEIMLLLKKLAKTTDKSILVATHDLDLALQTADKFWLAHCDQPLIEGIPEELVLNGDLSLIFSMKDYSFDLQTGKIKITYPFDRFVDLQGEPKEKLYWTKTALERNQIGTNQQALIKIKVFPHGWKIKNQEKSIFVDNLSQLIEHITKDKNGKMF